MGIECQTSPLHDYVCFTFDSWIKVLCATRFAASFDADRIFASHSLQRSKEAALLSESSTRKLYVLPPLYPVAFV